MWLQLFYNLNVNYRKFLVNVSLYFEFIFLICLIFILVRNNKDFICCIYGFLN